MKKENVSNVIDNTIKKSLYENKGITCIIDDLRNRCGNIRKVIDKSDADTLSLFNVLLGLTNEEDIDFTKIPTRARYAYFYITMADKRIADLKWLLLNSSKLKKQISIEKQIDLFNLLVLKDKIQNKIK